MESYRLTGTEPQYRSGQPNTASASAAGLPGEASMLGMNVQPVEATRVMSPEPMEGVWEEDTGKFIQSRFTCAHCMNHKAHDDAEHTLFSIARLNQIENGIYRNIVSQFLKHGFDITKSCQLAESKMRIDEAGRLSCLFSKQSYPSEAGTEAIRHHRESDHGRSCLHASKVPVSLFVMSTFENGNFQAMYEKLLPTQSAHNGDLVIKMAENGLVYNSHKDQVLCLVCDQTVSNPPSLTDIHQHMEIRHQILPVALEMRAIPINEGYLFESVVESESLTGHAFALLKAPDRAWLTHLHIAPDVKKNLPFIINYFVNNPEKCGIDNEDLTHLLFSGKKFHIRSHFIGQEQYNQIAGAVEIKKEAADNQELSYSALEESCNSYVSELASLADIEFPGKLSDIEITDHPCTIFLLHGINPHFSNEDRASIIFEKCCYFMKNEKNREPLINFMLQQGYEYKDLQNEQQIRKWLTSYIGSLITAGNPDKSA